MRKNISIIIVMFIVIMALTIKVKATTANVTLKADKLELDPGEVVTVTIAGSCEEGINALQAQISYETDKLELIDSNVTSSNWVNLGQSSTSNLTLEIICNTSETIKSDDIFEMKFKVKDSIARGTTAKITASEISLGSDSSGNYSIGNKDITISVKEETVEPITEPTEPVQPTENPVQQQGREKNKEEKLPQTGEKTPIIIASGTIILVIAGSISYIKYKKYRGI